MLCGAFGEGGGACRILLLKGLWVVRSHRPLYLGMTVDKRTIQAEAHGSIPWEASTLLIAEGQMHHRHLLPCRAVVAHHSHPYKLLRRTCQPTEEDDRKRRAGSLL